MSQPAEVEPEDQGNEPTEITFDEHLHPARPLDEEQEPIQDEGDDRDVEEIYPPKACLKSR